MFSELSILIKNGGYVFWQSDGIVVNFDDSYPICVTVLLLWDRTEYIAKDLFFIIELLHLLENLFPGKIVEGKYVFFQKILGQT